MSQRTVEPAKHVHVLQEFKLYMYPVQVRTRVNTVPRDNQISKVVQ